MLTGEMKAHKSNLESHRVILSFFDLTLCVWRCTSPATTSTLDCRLDRAGNDRLTARTTEKVTVSIMVRVDTYARSLVIVINPVLSLLRENEHGLFTNSFARKRTKTPLRLERSRRTAKGKFQVERYRSWLLSIEQGHEEPCNRCGTEAKI